MLMTTDSALVRRAALGDREAFALIYEESFRCIHAFAARETQDRAAAEVLTERILVRVFEALDRYAGDVPFAAWLQAIAKTVAADEPSHCRPSRVAPKPPFAHSSPR
jgi:RNA polymerase sigma-70 factor, ECF subfamily